MQHSVALAAPRIAHESLLTISRQRLEMRTTVRCDFRVEVVNLGRASCRGRVKRSIVGVRTSD